MYIVLIFRALTVLTGCAVAALAFRANVLRGMNEKWGVLWTLAALFLIVFALLPEGMDWLGRMKPGYAFALYGFLELILVMLFQATRELSALRLKNQELAMRLVLLEDELKKAAPETEDGAEERPERDERAAV